LHTADHASPSDLETQTGIDISHVSTTLKGLREAGLAELLVDESTRKGKLHGITEEGEAVIESLGV
jgi:DNA-binding MarR family transcriptional regulator